MDKNFQPSRLMCEFEMGIVLYYFVSMYIPWEHLNLFFKLDFTACTSKDVMHKAITKYHLF